MKIFALLLLMISFGANALEVDEKLTVRLLKTSETRKTLMVNRGTEDGLVEGDHAKFIVTAGIVARAVCVKVSPTRSVWSVYRLVNADFIVNDSVMTIKISPAVKITKDESKTLVQEDTPTRASGDPTQLGIPLADGAQDLQSNDSLSDDDLKALDSNDDTTPAIIPEKNVELFGILNISGLTASTKTDSGSDTYNTSQQYHHIGLGAEFYPKREREWYSHFSFQAMFNLMRNNSQAYDGSTSTNDVMEFSGGINWHPTKLPSQTMTFIPYLSATVNVGTVKSKFEPGQISGQSGAQEIEANGSSIGFAIGGGYKFFTRHGFTARAILDYYIRSEEYQEDDATFKFNKRVGGPRFMIGLGYRF